MPPLWPTLREVILSVHDVQIEKPEAQAIRKEGSAAAYWRPPDGRSSLAFVISHFGGARGRSGCALLCRYASLGVYRHAALSVAHRISNPLADTLYRLISGHRGNRTKPRQMALSAIVGEVCGWCCCRSSKPRWASQGAR